MRIKYSTTLCNEFAFLHDSSESEGCTSGCSSKREAGQDESEQGGQMSETVPTPKSHSKHDIESKDDRLENISLTGRKI